ncbi:GGDEF domain-containing protein [Mycolicibacterium chubuense]|uniref:Response regulator PleD n=1 Tax=Mycolicibacterium chubuense TaxID=1800 RepID=A0A0J6YKN9_MYCCU|nr:sensor domain-containing diguanylate cyclase [Mycolicibacterium chubuense]KMO73361.1 Response regulator PleD [Mycolicibacterium chubuense]ORA56846.1 GGDEF domain-containing protein [Mycolicibacterium chubuense]SPX98895.1 PAS/PAC sensor-containing diguanylate cyclase [Mycolicibacterium chubuense]
MPDSGFPMPANEDKRMQVLADYKILDSLPEQAYDDFAKLASAICGTPIALITLVDDHRQWFKAKVGLGVSETPRSEAFCAHAIIDPGQVMTVEDATLDERFAANPLVTGDPGIRFYAGAPLVAPTGEALGTICVIDREPRSLSETQREALEILSREIIVQLELRRSISTLEQAVLDQEQYVELLQEYQRDIEKVRVHLESQSVTDVLTGLKNRRSFDLTVEEEFMRAKSRSTTLSLLMIDVDYFKSFNDDFGHPAGDEVLRSVAHLLQSEVRGSDTLFRYGGEEFAVILPETTCKGAFVLAERFRRAVQRAPWPKRAITISVGVAAIDADTVSPRDLLQSADQALYSAKQTGRNRATMAAGRT